MSGEFDLIRWFRDRSTTGGSTVLGIGDDCAIVRPSPNAELLITTDMLMEGRHFLLCDASPADIGYKAMAVNLSDIAAMAGRPLAAVVAVALPKSGAIAIAHQLHAGLSEAARAYGVEIVGGDTNAWDGPLVVSVTLLGESVGRGAVRRSGARPGDLIFVTGPLGGSLLGRHLRPTPRLNEALAINEAIPIHAMIDVSDGLASDLSHILEESGGLGAILDERAIPIHPDAFELSRSGSRTPLDHALSDGEDFELCLVVHPTDAERLLGQAPVPLFQVGRIVEAGRLSLESETGELRLVDIAGFDHLRD